jgi:hypothetical protein
MARNVNTSFPSRPIPLVEDEWNSCEIRVIKDSSNVGSQLNPLVGFDSRIIVNFWPLFVSIFSLFSIEIAKIIPQFISVF